MIDTRMLRNRADNYEIMLADIDHREDAALFAAILRVVRGLRDAALLIDLANE